MSVFLPHRSGSDLRQRARPPTEAELAEIPWLQRLDAPERERAVDALVLGEAEAGDYVCRVGRKVTYWFGLVDGLLKMSNDDASGTAITLIDMLTPAERKLMAQNLRTRDDQHGAADLRVLQRPGRLAGQISSVE